MQEQANYESLGFFGLHNPVYGERLKAIIKTHNETVTNKTPKVQVQVSAFPTVSRRIRINTPRMQEIDQIIDQLEAEHEVLRSDSMNWKAGLPRRIEIRRMINELDTEWERLDSKNNG